MKNTIYIKIKSNHFEMRHIEKANTILVPASEPFTSERLLVGSFTNAEKAMAKGLKELKSATWLFLKPRILIQPIEKTEGGLSEVEDRVLRELASISGAKKIAVWVGYPLSDQEVIEKIENV